MPMSSVRLLAGTGLAMLIVVATGCQTNMGGMTLPSGRYLEHPPQYFPEDPDFPLEKELASQERTLYQNQNDLPGNIPLPPPVPPPLLQPKVVIPVAPEMVK